GQRHVDPAFVRLGFHPFFPLHASVINRFNTFSTVTNINNINVINSNNVTIHLTHLTAAQLAHQTAGIHHFQSLSQQRASFEKAAAVRSSSGLTAGSTAQLSLPANPHWSEGSSTSPRPGRTAPSRPMPLASHDSGRTMTPSLAHQSQRGPARTARLLLPGGKAAEARLRA